MSAPVEFLLARIAEDESVARDALHQERSGRPFVQVSGGGVGIRALVDPSRMVADSLIKRGTVGLLAVDASDPKNAVRRELAAELLLLMAAQYADHPDYPKEWKP